MNWIGPVEESAAQMADCSRKRDSQKIPMLFDDCASMWHPKKITSGGEIYIYIYIHIYICWRYTYIYIYTAKIHIYN